jgi:hypothetical protein
MPYTVFYRGSAAVPPATTDVAPERAMGYDPSGHGLEAVGGSPVRRRLRKAGAQ